MSLLTALFVLVIRHFLSLDHVCGTLFGWWRGLAVTRWSRSTKLLYAGPG